MYSTLVAVDELIERAGLAVELKGQMAKIGQLADIRAVGV